MLSRSNSMAWMDGSKEMEETNSWANQNNTINGVLENKDDDGEFGALSSFKTMLEAENEADWYMSATAATTAAANSMHGGTHHELGNISFSPKFTHDAVDSSASCSPTSASVLNSLDPSHQFNYFLPQKSTLMNQIHSNLLDGSFDLGCGTGILNPSFNDLTTQSQLGNFIPQFPANNLLQLPQTSVGSGVLRYGETPMNVVNPLFLNRSKFLKPLDDSTLFQKRAALRKDNLAIGNSRSCNSLDGYEKKGELSDVSERKRKLNSSGDDGDDFSIDGSNLNYDSDDQFLENTKLDENGKNGGNSSNANSTVTGGGAGGGGDYKGKKKGLPAKNLMAERRRRKKLNDRLYLLRSVVPKISKMDRASILGDAIEYLKELVQKINDLQSELESTPCNSSLSPLSNLYPLTPTTPGIPCRIKEELCQSAFASPLSSPTGGQPARVEVRLREGRAVNIHMFCGRRPGLLLSTMRALDNLGLDIQQAVISCFNGFALDIFRAEQSKDAQELHPDQIKAVLLDSAGFHGIV